MKNLDELYTDETPNNARALIYMVLGILCIMIAIMCWWL